MLLTGQFIFSLDLLSTPAMGVGSWDFSLRYLANNGVNDLFGIGWNYSQNYRLTQPISSEVVLNTPDNTEAVYTSAGGGQWSSGGNNTGATLVEINPGTANDTFILTSNSGTVTVFFGFNSAIATPGRIKSITDRHGNTQTFAWAATSGVAQLLSVTDSYGRVIRYSYYDATYGYKCSDITDFLGRQLNFQYDSNGRLVAVVLPSINSAAPGNTFPDGRAYIFQYDVNNGDAERQNDLIGIWYPNQTQPYVSNRVVNVAAVYANAAQRYMVAYGQSAGIAFGRVMSETIGDPAAHIGGTHTFSYTTSGLPSNLIDPSDPIVSQTTWTDRNGNIKTYNFNGGGMVVMKQLNANRNKLSLQSGPWITWTQYNAQNQKLLEVLPAGNSVAYVYDSGMIDFGSGPQLYPPRQGLLLSETRYPGNSIGIPSRSGSNAQTQGTTAYFYDPVYNQVCAQINEKGNPITVSGGANVYFTPQNGGTAPTDADRSRYATVTYFDYQKNQTATITNDPGLQDLLGLTAAQIQALINYANSQMTAGGLPNGFATNLGDINGDNTGNGTGGVGPQRSTASAMQGATVKIQHPSVYQLTPQGGGGNPWAWQTQQRIELFTNNFAGQTTTHTDPEGNLTVYVRYPENDPEGNGQYAATFLSNKQYGRLREVHVDADPNQVMDLVGADGDLIGFTGNIIPRVNTASTGQYLDLITRYEGGSGASGCPTCAYDALGNALAMTDPNGNTTSFLRTEMGEEYLRTGPAPYLFQVQTYYDSNRNTIRIDTQDLRPAYESMDPSDAEFAQFNPSGNGTGSANVPMQSGPGGTIRPGWFTNLYTFDLLDDKISDDLDATGSDPPNRVTGYADDANQNLIQITRPNGNLLQSDYDERDLRIAQRLGFVSGGDPGSVTVSVHDANGNALNLIGPANRGNSFTSLTCTINNAFNSGNALTQTGDWLAANTYDGFDRLISVTDAIGGVVNNTFDPVGAVIQSQTLGMPNGPTPNDRTGSGNVPLELAQTRFDEAGRPYESQQNIFLNTGLSGSSPTNNLPSGRTVMYSGGGLAANSPTNSNTATVTLTTGGQSYVLVRTVYDRSSRITAVGQDNGAVTQTAYDGANRPISIIDPLGNRTITVFDGNGNPVSITQNEYYTITQPPESYDAFTTMMAYDCMNQRVLTAQNGPDNSIAPRGGVNLARISLSAHDSRGNVTLEIDPNGNTTVTLYDGANRKLAIRQHLRQNGLGSNPPGNNTTFTTSGQGQVAGSILNSFEYDGNSNLTAQVDDRGGVTRWAYDSHNRKTSLTYHDGSAENFAYDPADDVVQYTDANGSVFTNVWDPMGRKTSTSIVPAAGVGGTSAQSFQYSGLAQMTFARDTAATANADVTLVYDSLQRTVEEVQTYGGNTRYLTNTAFASLPAGQFTFPNGRQVKSTFDPLYRRQQVIEQSTSAVLASWRFIGPNRVVEVVLGNGLIQTMLNNARTHSAVQSGSVPNPPWGTPSGDRLGYDGSGRLIAKRYLAGGINSGTFAYNNTNPVVGNTTAYDPADNKLYERALQAESRSFLYQPVDGNGDIASPSAGYDSVNRLVQYQRGILSSTGGYQNAGGGSVTTQISLANANIQENWNLDGLGNWRELVTEPVVGINIPDQRSHNRLNQITQRALAGASATAFQYDGAVGASNGNLANDGRLIYAYDPFNRPILIKRVSDGLVIAAYVYDALNRRIRKTISNGGLTDDLSNETTDALWCVK